ncbi:MAG: CD1375 family protein [Eubacteriales bacterium]|nr:CD1375 family protein [Eubacteriales bacterium]
MMLTKIFLIVNLMFRKGVYDMAVVYATLIIKGVKKYADVPARIKEQVKQVLIDLDCPELAE